MIAAPVFRFDEARHEYELDGVRLPSITQLISLGGLVNGEAYFTEASRNRGTAIHAMTANFDLGVDLGEQLQSSPLRGYVLAYMAAVDALKPTWECIEEADYSARYRFAGRTDRIGMVFGKRTVCEIKSAVKAAHHSVQTSLQSILAAENRRMPNVSAEKWQRLTIYLKPTGKYSIDRHEDRRDFDVAQTLISRFC